MPPVHGRDGGRGALGGRAGGGGRAHEGLGKGSCHSAKCRPPSSSPCRRRRPGHACFQREGHLPAVAVSFTSHPERAPSAAFCPPAVKVGGEGGAWGGGGALGSCRRPSTLARQPRRCGAIQPCLRIAVRRITTMPANRSCFRLLRIENNGRCGAIQPQEGGGRGGASDARCGAAGAPLLQRNDPPPHA